MASIYLYLDIRQSYKNTAPIKIAIGHKNSTIYVSTRIRISPDQWDNDARKVVRHPNKQLINSILHNKILECETRLLQAQFEGVKISEMKIWEVKHLVMGDNVPKGRLFLPDLEAFIKTKKADGTVRVYEDTKNRLCKYLGDEVKNLTFETMTPLWLTNFDNWMSSTLRANSRAIIMRNIRTVFNVALGEEQIQCYPFRKFKIKHERTRKRSISVDQLRYLKDASLSEAQSMYRDVFMLAFYLIGINMADLLPLTGLVNGRVEYRRAKTGRLYSIKVEPEAMALINRYKGKTHLLSFGDKYKSSSEFNHVIAHRLKAIKNFEFLSIYWARHTWATIASELDIPKETIAAALGHSDNSVTDIYIRFDERKIDIANRKVIDYLNEKE